MDGPDWPPPPTEEGPPPAVSAEFGAVSIEGLGVGAVDEDDGGGKTLGGRFTPADVAGDDASAAACCSSNLSLFLG